MKPLRLLLVHPGASYSTADVFNGYLPALKALGHEVLPYAMDARIDMAGAYYKTAYRRLKLGAPPAGLILTKAASDIIPQALYHDVDGVLIVSGMYLPPDILVMLRRAHIRTALILTESPYDDEAQSRVVPLVDLAFTNERISVPYLRQFQPNTHYLGHAFDPLIHRPLAAVDAETPQHDVVFVGSFFEERIDLLGAVDWDGINLGLYGEFSILPSRHRLRKHIAGGVVPNVQAAALYRAAKIGLNLYRTSKGFGVGTEKIAHAESLSPRGVELAACGSFHLSEYRAEVAEVFGEVVPTFGNAADLERLIRHYLSREEDRHATAQALPAAVSGHTYAARAADVMQRVAATWARQEQAA